MSLSQTESVVEVLEALKATGDLDYSMVEDKITISSNKPFYLSDASVPVACLGIVEALGLLSAHDGEQ